MQEDLFHFVSSFPKLHECVNEKGMSERERERQTEKGFYDRFLQTERRRNKSSNRIHCRISEKITEN